MKIVRQLLVVGATSCAALVSIAALMAIFAAVDSANSSNALLSPRSAATITFGYTVLIGTLPALLFGAPAYVLLLQKGHARWQYAIALGALPGLAILSFDPNLGFWATTCGIFVALVTHAVVHRLGPNNSFKPRPLRGSA